MSEQDDAYLEAVTTDTVQELKADLDRAVAMIANETGETTAEVLARVRAYPLAESERKR